MSEYDYAYDSTYPWSRTITITSTQRVQLNFQPPLHSKANFGQILRQKEWMNEWMKARKKDRKKERKKKKERQKERNNGKNIEKEKREWS